VHSFRAGTQEKTMSHERHKDHHPDHSKHSEHSNHSKHSAGAVVTDSERREGSRHIFTAAADVVEVSSGARFSTRTTDLGPGGCFVDTTNPFPVGSKLHVRLHKGKTSFETAGIVVYSQNGLGMGIAFSDLAQERRSALESWLADLTGERQSHDVVTYETRATLSSSPQRGGSASTSLVRLVQLMIGKGILTEAEGASVLIDPVL
jgi:PilZ domain